MQTKKKLAIALSGLAVFDNPSLGDEQYPTDPEIAADGLWQAHMLGDIAEKDVIDLGAGTGILGIAALLLGARSCVFVERDKEAMGILRQNVQSVGKSSRIFTGDMKRFTGTADIVLENPPFGTRKVHADRDFLKKAFTLAPVVYSFHKTSTRSFIASFAEENHFAETHRWDYSFALKRTFLHHTRRIHRIPVSLHRFISLK